MSRAACEADRGAGPTRRRAAAARVLPIALLFVAGCTRPLPEAESPAAKLYVAQCGMCHVAYHPGLMTPAMWEIQVARMDEQRGRRGLPPLAADDRRVILQYLRAHAG